MSSDGLRRDGQGSDQTIVRRSTFGLVQALGKRSARGVGTSATAGRALLGTLPAHAASPARLKQAPAAGKAGREARGGTGAVHQTQWTLLRKPIGPLRWPSHRPGGGNMGGTVRCHCLTSRSSCLFVALRRLFSSGPQRWQNLHFSPALQPSLDRCRKSHGLHNPRWWPADPTEGSPGELTAVASRVAASAKTGLLSSAAVEETAAPARL